MNETEIKIDRLTLEGDGVGRLAPEGPSGGKVAFVPYTLPNEVVSARLLWEKKNHSRWLPTKINQPALGRVNPSCPYHFHAGRAGSWCGGCNWQPMSEQSQREAKRQLVVETLTRLGGLPNPPVKEPIPSPQNWRYRNKVQVPFGSVPFGSDGRRVIAGFYAPESHAIVEFEDCLVQPELSVRIVREVKALANRFQWSPYNEDEHKGWLRHLLVRTNEAGQATVTLVTAQPAFRDLRLFLDAMKKTFPQMIGVHQNVQPARTHVILGRQWIRLWGAERMEENVLGLRIAASPGSFFQVNKGAADLLFQRTIEELNPDRESAVADLYSGVGALTLLAAQRAAFALGVESVRTAVRDARHNATVNRLANVEFLEADVEKDADRVRRRLEVFAAKKLLVILDPPRSGCDPRLLNSLMELRPHHIVYVSCHPATLARDIKILSPRFRLESVTPVDLFPQTSHIETVSRLEGVKSHL